MMVYGWYDVLKSKQTAQTVDNENLCLFMKDKNNFFYRVTAALSILVFNVIRTVYMHI